MEGFHDRCEAGKVLAVQLQSYAKRGDAIVLALPRGGVPVAYEIAKALALPLDIFVVRKLGVPGHEELAMGAIAAGGVVFNSDILAQLNISQAAIDNVIQAEQQELQRRMQAYRGDHPFPVLTHKTVILVDDGMATGATMRAAIQSIRQQKPARIVVAVPVAAREASEEIAREVEELVCPLKPRRFSSVGMWYVDFSQTTDEEVRALLRNI